MKKDKQKVIGEELTDERIKELLSLNPEDGVNRDYFILMKAYRALRTHDFARFVVFFREAGLDLEATGPEGRTLKAEMAEHAQAKEYIEILS